MDPEAEYMEELRDRAEVVASNLAHHGVTITVDVKTAAGGTYDLDIGMDLEGWVVMLEMLNNWCENEAFKERPAIDFLPDQSLEDLLGDEE